MDFDAPEESWADIFGALSPSELDPKPLKWDVLGCLRIKTPQGQEVTVGLFNLKDVATGAFDVESGSERGSYYRGGNTTQLTMALSKAYAAYQRRTVHGGKAEPPQSNVGPKEPGTIDGADK